MRTIIVQADTLRMDNETFKTNYKRLKYVLTDEEYPNATDDKLIFLCLYFFVDKYRQEFPKINCDGCDVHYSHTDSLIECIAISESLEDALRFIGQALSVHNMRLKIINS